MPHSLRLGSQIETTLPLVQVWQHYRELRIQCRQYFIRDRQKAQLHGTTQVSTETSSSCITGPHQRVSPAKYFAAFRRISRSSSSSRTFFRKAAFFASSGAGGWAASGVRRPRGRLAPAALTQFRKVSGLIPRSAATDLIVASGRDSYSATASALNSGG